mmetsp:Transcript_50389/g.163062  ORF Transcript_50389/g.163062 Transcript_50389/m.163062 type:complete len:82 (+) Transcript_50389:155-400(+)
MMPFLRSRALWQPEASLAGCHVGICIDLLLLEGRCRGKQFTAGSWICCSWKYGAAEWQFTAADWQFTAALKRLTPEEIPPL